ncbi:hypothetical protein HPB50_025513 [Hyalomma asiaticum]|uniref:Uncharacterized protein n=1 Tax=Hyalomma asiaticum TaxID=266040 RepID=A0ACB7SSN2_HYAAI|nr:hypothetical protein HPB50_025513 [Hyalomma asiaticum]
MLCTPPGSRSKSPSPVTTPVHRYSQWLLGIAPELLTSHQETSPTPCLPLPMASPRSAQVAQVPPAGSTDSLSQVTFLQPLVPDRFHGGAHQDIAD